MDARRMIFRKRCGGWRLGVIISLLIVSNPKNKLAHGLIAAMRHLVVNLGVKA
jgi:hypothetical protein